MGRAEGEEGEEEVAAVEEEEAAVAVQTSLSLVEIGNVQPEFGMMEMISVSLRNRGWKPDQMFLPEEEGRRNKGLKPKCLCRPYI